MVLEYCQLQSNGITCDEVEKALDIVHQTASPRFTELVQKGLLIKTEETRLTQNGDPAVVYRAANLVTAPDKPSEPEGEDPEELAQQLDDDVPDLYDPWET